AAVGSVQFFLDGKALGAPVTKPPYAVSWNTREAADGSHTLTATAIDTSGNVGNATPVEVTVENPAEEGPCFVMDVNTTVNGRNTVTTPTFTTAEAGEQLFAFVASDGPAGAGMQSAKVSGAGLAWTLVTRANSQSGDAEIWTATATKQLKGKKVKSKLAAKGFDQSLTVISMQMSKGAGASVAGGAPSGAPSVSLTTTEDGTLVYAVGSDWSSATARTLGSNQVILRQDLDAGFGKTFWSQYTGHVTGMAGETVTLDDTAPTGDQWNMAAVEILGDGLGN
ncbi:MAG TPA: Ig-like domain-containing protein, partial [Solirubrobacteraceae bacterium]|nr:Ig-like domain-containing protein [Solirubrobacteraceae bacterium]